MCILVGDGLKGLPDSVAAIWPLTIVQTCVIHLLRNTFRYAGRQDWEKIAKDLRPLYTAATDTAFPSVWHDLVMPRRSRCLVEVRGISSTGVAVVDDTRREDDVSKRSLREKSESRPTSRLPLIDRSPALAYPE